MDPPRPRWLALILSVEVVLGLTGYFAADFRDALMLAALALVETFRPRRVGHWLSLTLIAVATFALGVMWTGIKESYRKDFRHPEFAGSTVARLERVTTLASAWLEGLDAHAGIDVDRLVQRMWAIKVQALALKRVPQVVPHEGGALLFRSLAYVATPRFLKPDKDRLDDADNDMVRRYAGIKIATAKEGTSFAFGYVAEAYVDFGVPLCLLPILLFGVLMGAAYRFLFLLVRNRELAVLVVVPVFWTSLYSYERSWVKTIGATLTAMLVAGAAGQAFDLYLRGRRPPEGRG
jgi:hypothetical protein